MKFSEVVAQTLAWLQRDERVSYRALKREFELDDEALEDLKVELIDVQRVAPCFTYSLPKLPASTRSGNTE